MLSLLSMFLSILLQILKKRKNKKKILDIGEELLYN